MSMGTLLLLLHSAKAAFQHVCCSCSAACRTWAFNQGSGQSTAVVPLLGCELLECHHAVSFRFNSCSCRSWRMMGICLLSPGAGIAEGPPGYFHLVSPVLLLPSAPPGMCPGLLLLGGFGMWLLSLSRKAFKAASVTMLDTLYVQGLSCSLAANQRDSHAQLPLKDASFSLP